MIDIIVAKALESATEVAAAVFVDALKSENNALQEKGMAAIDLEFAVVSSIARNALAEHVLQMKAWSRRVKFNDLRQEKSISSIYVQLNTFLMPLNMHQERSERQQVLPLLDVLRGPEHSVVMGAPGAGKTTSLQKICDDYFRTGKALTNYNFPILVRLREVSTAGDSEGPLFQVLQELLALSVIVPDRHKKNADQNMISRVRNRVLSAYIDDLRIVLLLDGFDEIASESVRARVYSDVVTMSSLLRKSKIVLTSRSGEVKHRFSELSKFEIAPLTKDQVSEFCFRWLENRAEAEDFLAQVMKSPFADAAMRPLAIAHLCAIYERLKRIPEKPRSVYRKLVQLLLEEWDAQRGIARKSAYSDFEGDRKIEFLAHIAFILTTAGKIVFSHEDLENIYKRIHIEYGLPKGQSMAVMSEVESHNGLLVQGGYREYEFAHKSMQEFLTADFLVRLPNMNVAFSSIGQMPNEFAIATAMSSKPSLYFIEIVLGMALRANMKPDWYLVFLTRLALEKADFTTGFDPDAALASLVCLSQLPVDEQLSFGFLLHPMLKGDVRKTIFKYYGSGTKSKDSYIFQRISPHAKFGLPDAFRLGSAAWQAAI